MAALSKAKLGGIGLPSWLTRSLEDVYREKYGGRYPGLAENVAAGVGTGLKAIGLPKHIAETTGRNITSLVEDWTPAGALTAVEEYGPVGALAAVPVVGAKGKKLAKSLGAAAEHLPNVEKTAAAVVDPVAPQGLGIKGYHGSPNEFASEPGYPLGRLDIGESREGNYGKAGYFHEAQEDAARYKHEGGKVYEADLNIRNPFYMDRPVKNVDAIRIAEAFGNEKLVKTLSETGQDIRNGNELWHWILAQGGSQEKKRQAIQAAGFDAIIGDPGKAITGQSTRSREIAVFDPKLISIVKKYGIPAAIASGLISEEMGSQMQQQGEI